MATAPAPILIDRADVHKSCKSLEAIVSVLSDYTEAANALAAVQKKLAKALKETASVKGTSNVPGNAMSNSVGVFECLAEVNAKFAKIADREVESTGSELKKWFKKLAKEEKAHDERITTANARIKQAGQAYEKKAKKKDRDAAEEHSRYLAILNSVGPDMSQDKYNHSLLVTQRHTMTLSGFAASISRLAEAEWARACESVRRSAPSIGTVGEWRALCEGGWSGPVPADLPDLGATEYERDRRSDAMDNTRDAMRTLMLTPPTDVQAGSTTYRNDPESPTNTFITRNLPPTSRSSESHSVADHSSSNTMSSRPPSPPSVRESMPNTLKKRSIPNDTTNAPSIPPPIPETTTAVTSGSSSAAIAPISNVKSAAEASATPDISSARLDESNPPHTTSDDRNQVIPDRLAVAGHPSDPDGSIKPETKMTYSPTSISQDPPPFTTRESLTGERNQAAASNKKPDLFDKRERERKIIAPSPVSPKPSTGSGKTGGILDRRLSVESSASNHSLVATMKDRYDTRPAKPSSPPPRDLPRLSQSVTDLATRYTPGDTPTSPYRANLPPPAQSGPSSDRFTTFQDRQSRTVVRADREKERYRAPPESSAADPRYFSDRDKERYRYADSPTADRDQFLRDERDRERYRTAPTRPRSPDRQYVDELGVRDWPRRIETVEEMALQEREEALREKEHQLDMERARIMSAREAGYGSDTSSRSRAVYGMPRRSESPGPMTSQQSLRPPPNDHSPNCGCQRCSAQHYASSTPSLPRARYDSQEGSDQRQHTLYKPDPPIKLRPEPKPKNWLRRMSMPLVPSSDKKSAGGAGQSNWASGMTLPEEDDRIMRRSFELERDRETAARFGGTRR